jgi:hypothetical protein
MAVLRAAIASFLFVAACDVGEVPTSGASPTPDAPQAGSDAASTDTSVADPAGDFTTKIQPIVSGLCTGCHAGGQPPNLTSYTALEATYKRRPGASNILVTKGAHLGPALNATQKDTVIKWIDSITTP